MKFTCVPSGTPAASFSGTGTTNRSRLRVLTGKHHIEHSKIEWLRTDSLEALFSGVRNSDRVRLGFQAFLQGLCDLRFVFHQEYSQACLRVTPKPFTLPAAPTSHSSDP